KLVTGVQTCALPISRSRGGDEIMKGDLHIIFNLFASSSRLQKKRAYLTIAAIAWGTVAILLLLAFGEGLKRQLDKNRRSTGENRSEERRVGKEGRKR